MKLFLLFKKNYFKILLIIFSFVGIFLSLNVGITHDELHDLKVWEANKKIFHNLFTNQNYDTSYLDAGGKFYGVGFHIFSFPFEILSQKLIFNENFKNETKLLLAKHASVFLLFTISAIYFRKILKIFIKERIFLNLSTTLYLLYPYLLGHSFFNVKDIPFLSIWLICTFLIIKISKNLIENKGLTKKHFFWIILSTAYLISIRVSGILIFIEYLIFILFSINYLNIELTKFLKIFYKKLVTALISIFILIIALQPSYWEDPLLFFKGIIYMSNHIQTVCTITLGECMKAQELPISYLPIWIFFKLPLIILFGLILFPFVEKNFHSKNLLSLTLFSLIISTLSIILLLIIFKVNLYDEIRQVMFLLPAIFIISLILIYIFSQKLFKILSTITILFFIAQNMIIYPYNYIWINNLSHLTKVKNIFELDYWGVSTKPIAKFINLTKIKETDCIISNRNHALNSFFDKKNCTLPFNKLHSHKLRPFYVAYMERSLKKGTPNNCKLIFQEKINLNFSNEELVLAKLFKCE